MPYPGAFWLSNVNDTWCVGLRSRLLWIRVRVRVIMELLLCNLGYCNGQNGINQDGGVFMFVFVLIWVGFAMGSVREDCHAATHWCMLNFYTLR